VRLVEKALSMSSTRSTRALRATLQPYYLYICQDRPDEDVQQWWMTSVGPSQRPALAVSGCSLDCSCVKLCKRMSKNKRVGRNFPSAAEVPILQRYLATLILSTGNSGASRPNRCLCLSTWNRNPFRGPILASQDQDRVALHAHKKSFNL
jgi:hypothetical protein